MSSLGLSRTKVTYLPADAIRRERFDLAVGADPETSGMGIRRIMVITSAFSTVTDSRSKAHTDVRRSP